MVPDEVYKYCRPQSIVEAKLRVEAEGKMRPKTAQKAQVEPFFFQDMNEDAIPYQYEVNFHNQLKARLLEYTVLTQIILESTIAHNDFRNKFDQPIRNLDALQSEIAWNISTTVFYKAGGRPWKISSIRDGVCYIGIVFKQDETNPDPRSACCAAQMFLDSSDGVVFKGAVGPWYTPGRGEYHLSRSAAKELVGIAVKSYSKKWGKPPKELFLHGKVRFDDEEWLGFQESIDSSTNLVGVRMVNLSR